jgi:hypothetical protein
MSDGGEEPLAGASPGVTEPARPITVADCHDGFAITDIVNLDGPGSVSAVAVLSRP